MEPKAVNPLHEALLASGINQQIVSFKRGEVIMKGAQVADAVYFVLKGSVAIESDHDLLEGQVIRLSYKGSPVVALDSFLEGTPSTFIIRALKETQLAKFSKAAVWYFFEHHERGSAFLIATLKSLVLQQMEREVDLLINDPAARYQRVLARSPQLFQEVPHKYIANYLRMTPETLSRLKKY
jgi:CRP-like cAMP-binding protein